ncbi:MAG: hypothetical protein WA667_00815 [Candidatus Nitrosopolaris sp.]
MNISKVEAPFPFSDSYVQKWIRKKGICQITLAVDAKSKKVASFRITTGTVHDAKKVLSFCKTSGRKI